MPISPLRKLNRNMRATTLIRQLTQDEKVALLRGFLMAVETGLVDADEVLTTGQKAEMKDLLSIIEKHWSGA
ncbi:hypothetical protein [Nocardia sp. NRRL S-836]|uniref:hypothetical protein n=1 Tax=Nocardia sp. NRRL S-836 TaxID=1519492 RepID=UPI0006AE2967|nr:hypothetical protein [Nocardia sp. NRRL S-836]KOV84728.1 hypothetical protein ADL03_15790 [Nocardia sp. NRRL S-836]